ncbi:hypothetical protein BH24ACT15_BH24ACT15_30750 [soil metagenome]
MWLGYYGMVGMATNFKVQSGLFANYSEQGLIDGAGSTLACVDTTDGASDQGGAGRGGYLKALLVDTGGGSPLTDYPSPTLTATLQPQPHAAPTLTGILQAGGSGYVGVTHYYAIATVHGGVLSELSNVVGPFTTTDSERSVLLDFSGLASGADAIRLYRGNSPDFSQFSLYRFNDFGASDIPAGNPSVLDEFPGIDTRENTGFDPHWDLRYRQTKYYSVSALYADGVESACSAWVEVQLQPRNAPLSVEITIIPPPSGVAAVVSYTVRRMNRTYHWETALDRQWSVLPS